MKKYIFRQIPAEYADFSFYFDGDTFTGADRWGRVSGFNTEEYMNVKNQAENIIDEFSNIGGWNNYTTYKEVMQDFCIPYNPRKCHLLKEYAKDADADNPESIAEFLTITTGKTWAVSSARGYCQGDYVQIVYCTDYYSEQDAEAAGEIYLGAGNEYEFITVEDGEEAETVGGYFVADCQAWRAEDVKKLLCSWEGIDETETELQLVDDCKIRREYSYKTAC